MGARGQVVILDCGKESLGIASGAEAAEREVEASWKSDVLEKKK